MQPETTEDKSSGIRIDREDKICKLQVELKAACANSQKADASPLRRTPFLFRFITCDPILGSPLWSQVLPTIRKSSFPGAGLVLFFVQFRSEFRPVGADFWPWRLHQIREWRVASDCVGRSLASWLCLGVQESWINLANPSPNHIFSDINDIDWFCGTCLSDGADIAPVSTGLSVLPAAGWQKLFVESSCRWSCFSRIQSMIHCKGTCVAWTRGHTSGHSSPNADVTVPWCVASLQNNPHLQVRMVQHSKENAGKMVRSLFVSSLQQSTENVWRSSKKPHSYTLVESSFHTHPSDVDCTVSEQGDLLLDSCSLFRTNPVIHLATEDSPQER